ncbi:MAG: permease-like cell division protein FtsX [Eubacteriales bacterium]|nr:permease-like cell division protein FtsX [Eubacteriales bacterium]MDD3866130.1 permease-like cell division protein FtsX [Eubacteriales bacterium]MDD4461690.1 permease-like cell division protein FtsX [Eubacteriales bacterium]
MIWSKIRYPLTEGLRSLIRHPLVTLASMTTITLMLVLMGAFTVFSINARHIMEKAGQQPPIEITMELGVDPTVLNEVESALKADSNVLDFQRYSPQENFNMFKSSMENEDLFEDFPVENIPYTYSIRLVDPDYGEAFQAQISGIPGVRRVQLELTVMRFLSKAIVWVNYVTLAALLVLGVIAFFIISNMVRVAVFSRAEEINIMKYVGATNLYIRVPYILEGAIVGMLGALAAWLIVGVTYDKIYEILLAGATPDDFLTLVRTDQIKRLVLMINLVLGVGVGAVGSAVSVRRHVKV